MDERNRFTVVRFDNYKAFKKYSTHLRPFNVLVGPNNSGKSTIIGAFRLLSEGIRKAQARKPDVFVESAKTWGYSIDLNDLPVSTENVFHNYDDSQPAIIVFEISNGNKLELHFPKVRQCSMILRTNKRPVKSPTDFKREFNVSIGFVPILGPVEHNEPLFQKEAARLALLTHRASRNFRNIWFHYPENFTEFRALVQTTWPGMDIESPKPDYSAKDNLLHMFCPEERIPREIYWSGFGFQVWCQMLTFIIQAKHSSLLIMDEPDIYLHSDLQRQLISLLRDYGPDILIATHSTEIISEVEPDELVIVNKRRSTAKRVSNPGQLQDVFSVLGSNLNPTLTQLAKTKRVVFVEGKDFQVFTAFARKLGYTKVANRAMFAVIPVEGFNPQKVRDVANGIELTVGVSIAKVVVFDRDYRPDEVVEDVLRELKELASYAFIHNCKEIENYLLNPKALSRAARQRIKEREIQPNKGGLGEDELVEILTNVTDLIKDDIESQYLAKYYQYVKSVNPSVDPATSNKEALKKFNNAWQDFSSRMEIVPGKQVLSLINQQLQKKYQITLTANLIISYFDKSEVSEDMVEMIDTFDKFGDGD